ncbi:hypothetical protein QBC47DRAFT_365273 [Echria macrotheca]|uniref:DUF6604 domain-containing protein n=1 Tax=Echria macrotheca TaxID=438768 RepID=A0AAJ0B574_9PEZI|nr:hypothetical protein QBC47DRAFT_365273 [Echria macrotheca]
MEYSKIYKAYKDDELAFIEWLKTSASGYVLPFRGVGNAHDKHLIPIADFVPMAQYVKNQVSKAGTKIWGLKTHILGHLRSAIRARQEVTEKLLEDGKIHRDDKKAKNHEYFVKVLIDVWCILSDKD